MKSRSPITTEAGRLLTFESLIKAKMLTIIRAHRGKMSWVARTLGVAEFTARRWRDAQHISLPALKTIDAAYIAAFEKLVYEKNLRDMNPNRKNKLTE